MINLIYFDILYPEEWFPEFMKYLFRVNINDGLKDDDPVSI